MTWIEGNKTLAQVTEEIAGPLEQPASGLWKAAFAASVSLLGVFLLSIAYLVFKGVGTLGLNRTVGWAVLITTFVFWIGIGHAGTLISAILLLFRQGWRTSINRSAEAMTLFAVMCAGLFPVLHLGRPWFAYWLFPYPNFRGTLWPNFRSPLIWDVFAVSTYFTVSLVFWYLGLIPDLAIIRDRSTDSRRRWFGLFSLGWDGSARAWKRHEMAYLLLAGLATPLVLSVHSIVSFDFAVSILPGWHSTIFPPYFVAGAIFSGFAMVLTLLLVARKTMHLEQYITLAHIDAMNKVVLLTGSLVALSYFLELFTAWYSASPYEQFVFLNRLKGTWAWAYGLTIFCNVVLPQLFWSARLRRHLPTVFLVSLGINVGMWFERFIIIVVSLFEGFLPSSWRDYRPTPVELGLLVGSFGLFFTLFLLFARFLPMISMAEVKHQVAHG
jgi:molybdopterin-containing oxidoreductase family membrane subunit